jgi:hypothetical protein
MGYDKGLQKKLICSKRLDTAKGVKTALINAVSASNNLLRTKCTRDATSLKMENKFKEKH